MKIKFLTGFLFLHSACAVALFDDSLFSRVDRFLTKPIHYHSFKLEDRKLNEVSQDFYDIMKIPENWAPNMVDNVPVYQYVVSPFDKFDNVSYLYVMLDKVCNTLKSTVLGSIGTEFMLNKMEKTYSFYAKINKVRRSYLKEK